MSLVALLVTASPDKTIVQLSWLWSSIILACGLIFWAQLKQKQILIAVVLTALGVGFAVLSPFIVQWTLTKGGFVPNTVYEIFPLLLSDSVHPNVLAALMVLLFPIPVAYSLLNFTKSGRKDILYMLLGFAAVGIMLTALLLSKSRGGLLAGASAIFFVLWLGRLRKWAILYGILLLTVLTSILFFQGPKQMLQTTSGDILNPVSFMFRLHVWRIASWMLADFPFTGTGMGTFNEVAARLYPSDLGMFTNPGAHSLFLQIGVDLGLPGLIAMLAVFLLTLFMGIQRSSRTFARLYGRQLWAFNIGAVSGLMALLVHGIIDMPIWSTRGMFALWLVIGFITAVFVFTPHNGHTAG